ncbi:MAG: rRNA maturation RNase YbeY [Bacteroidota bacterium]|nr:rRNA maturation RNase YbeY [Bacteroidota bacterium]
MIVVSVTKAYKHILFSGSEIKHIAKFVCNKEKIKNAELSFIIVNDRAIRTINKKFLQHDYVTDVITFPLEIKAVNAEIYVNSQQAKRQAKENNVTVKNELTRLVVHGTLHAIGYDDTTKVNQKKMNAIQERYVSVLNLKK